jgi:hypothetical protein
LLNVHSVIYIGCWQLGQVVNFGWSVLAESSLPIPITSLFDSMATIRTFLYKNNIKWTNWTNWIDILNGILNYFMISFFVWIWIHQYIVNALRFYSFYHNSINASLWVQKLFWKKNLHSLSESILNLSRPKYTVRKRPVGERE